MARQKKSEKEIEDYRHSGETRKNNPPAKIAAEGVIPLLPKAQYAYSPRRSPELRFDADGLPDRIQDLLDEAASRPLAPEELELLRDALADQEPWLEWAEKQEQRRRGFFEVDPVALHIHERVSAQAILKVAARQDAQRSLFADPEQEYHEAVQFYQHDIDWTNRLILGDSLQVMSSLARREDLAGKVQMVYIDPPYGIRFKSNFQPQVGNRDVKDREQDLTREPEMVKAYRDTWHLGVHSYLTYLRDRLIAARELLAAAGSIFVQINDSNLHKVQDIMAEIFGDENYCGLIAFRTTGGQSTALISVSTDFLLWYARDKRAAQDIYTNPTTAKSGGTEASSQYTWVEPIVGGPARRMSGEEADHVDSLLRDYRILSADNLYGQGAPTDPDDRIFLFHGRELRCPPNSHWKPGVLSAGMTRLDSAERLLLVLSCANHR